MEQITSARPAKASHILLALVGLGIAGTGATYVWGHLRPVTPAAAATRVSAPPPVPVTLATVAKGPFPVALGGLGTVQAFNTVQIRSRVDGEIKNVAYREGQTVRKDDVLVEIDPRPYQASFDQAEAKKTQDEANLKNARADLDRYTRLGDYASRQQTETQASLVTQLTAQVAADKAMIDNARTQLSYATVRAPLDGITGFRQVDVGNIVNASAQTPVVTITQVEPIFVVYTAPEEQLPRIMAALAKGDVPVEAWSTDRQSLIASGKLALANNQVDTATGTIRLKAVFANHDHALWPGLSVSTRMQIGVVPDALIVPEDVVQHGPEGTFAFAVDADGIASQHEVALGLTNDRRTQVIKGLEDGQRVILEGQYRVQPGTRVSDAREARAAGTTPSAAGIAKGQ